jgi:ribosome-binding protein aMBF1 (putative translation factor)
MAIGQLMIDGRRYMVVEESEYSRLLTASSGTPSVREEDLPQLPQADSEGNVPALEYARISLARKLIIERTARGWSQVELARRTRLRVETINRLEKGRHTADPATAKKIQVAFDSQNIKAHAKRKTG